MLKLMAIGLQDKNMMLMERELTNGEKIKIKSVVWWAWKRSTSGTGLMVLEFNPWVKNSKKALWIGIFLGDQKSIEFASIAKASYEKITIDIPRNSTQWRQSWKYWIQSVKRMAWERLIFGEKNFCSSKRSW